MVAKKSEKRTRIMEPSVGQAQARNYSVALLPEEKIDFSPKPNKAIATDEELNSRYAKGDVRIVTESARYPLTGILAMLNERVEESGDFRYKLDPEYQRRHRWDDVRRSRLIESFLMNVPVPPIFLYETNFACFEVMDGRQRLTALKKFYNNDLRLKGLQYWPELDGRTYAELPKMIKDGIDRRYISSIILLTETAPNKENAAQLKKLVFERLNSGGVKLSPHEARNAVYDGNLNQLCFKLSENAKFKKMWGIPKAPDEVGDFDEESDSSDEPTDAGRKGRKGPKMLEEMEDVEMVLRFFAYRQIESFPEGLNKISAFLDSFLIEGNLKPESVLSGLREIFERTISFLYEILGEEAFCAIGVSQKRPSKMVYDPIMYVASGVSRNSDCDIIIKGKKILKSELKEMYIQERKKGNKENLFYGRNTNSSYVQPRNTRVYEAFEKALKRIKG